MESFRQAFFQQPSVFNIKFTDNLSLKEQTTQFTLIDNASEVSMQLLRYFKQLLTDAMVGLQAILVNQRNDLQPKPIVIPVENNQRRDAGLEKPLHRP